MGSDWEAYLCSLRQTTWTGLTSSPCWGGSQITAADFALAEPNTTLAALCQARLQKLEYIVLHTLKSFVISHLKVCDLYSDIINQLAARGTKERA